MMDMWFPMMIFGHLFGDFLFQNHWMASKKKENNHLPCIVHCTIYTIFVCLFVILGGLHLSMIQIILVFLSHWILDRYHNLDLWFNLIKTRSWDTNIPKTKSGKIDWESSVNMSTVVSISFGAVVYIVADNTIHLFLMFLIFTLL